MICSQVSYRDAGAHERARLVGSQDNFKEVLLFDLVILVAVVARRHDLCDPAREVFESLPAGTTLHRIV